jgi:hypothetical protein
MTLVKMHFGQLLNVISIVQIGKLECKQVSVYFVRLLNKNYKFNCFSFSNCIFGTTIKTEITSI